MKVTLLALYQLSNEEKNVYFQSCGDGSVGRVLAVQDENLNTDAQKSWKSLSDGGVHLQLHSGEWQAGWYLDHINKPLQRQDGGPGREPATQVQHTHVHKNLRNKCIYL